MILGLARSWSLAGYAVATILVLPLVALILQALQPDEAVWGHLDGNGSADLYHQQFIVDLLVSLGALLLALPCAWLMARCEFVGRRYLQWALFAPRYAGIYCCLRLYRICSIMRGQCSVALRSIFGWSSPQDYFFPIFAP